jgi:hypothetical protein
MREAISPAERFALTLRLVITISFLLVAIFSVYIIQEVAWCIYLWPSFQGFWLVHIIKILYYTFWNRAVLSSKLKHICYLKSCICQRISQYTINFIGLIFSCVPAFSVSTSLKLVNTRSYLLVARNISFTIIHIEIRFLMSLLEYCFVFWDIRWYVLIFSTAIIIQN